MQICSSRHDDLGVAGLSFLAGCVMDEIREAYIQHQPHVLMVQLKMKGPLPPDVGHSILKR